jgi:hypothetical protein
VLTAFAAYQTDLADGDTLKAFQEGSAVYDDANSSTSKATSRWSNDVNVFTQYAIASQKGDKKLANYIKDGLMDGSLPAATEECEEADGDLPSAIEADAYKLKPYEEAEKLVAEGDALFDQAAAKDGEGDSYTLATVILAISLFFGGVAGVTRSHIISVAMTLSRAAWLSGTGIYILTI